MAYRGNTVAVWLITLLGLVGCNDDGGGGKDAGPANGDSGAATDGGAGDTGDDVVSLSCEFPLTIAATSRSVYVCSADSAADCRVTNPAVNGVDEACEDPSFFFTLEAMRNSISAVNANGWVIDATTHGSQTANISVGALPDDTEVTVTLGKGGNDYDVVFEAQGSDASVTILSFTQL